MGKKRKKKRARALNRPQPNVRQPSPWVIVAAILFFFSAGLVLKMVYAPVSGTNSGSTIFQSASGDSANLEGQVRLVAANFRCACGQCGELFLIDCTCDMPRGAVEEKVPEGFDGKAQLAFRRGKEKDAMQFLYAHALGCNPCAIAVSFLLCNVLWAMPLSRDAAAASAPCMTAWRLC